MTKPLTIQKEIVLKEIEDSNVVINTTRLLSEKEEIEKFRFQVAYTDVVAMF